MNLTVRTWITFTILAVVMGLNNIYSTLLTGWGDGGSIVAVVLCLIFLSRQEGTIVNYNLGQTMASAGGSVGFTTAMVAAVYLIDPSWSPSLLKLSILVLSLSYLGVTLAIPLRRHIVKWFFPSGVACGIILKSVTSEDVRERRRARNIMGVSGVIAALLTLPTKIAFAPKGAALWSKISLPKELGVSLDPLLYGVGIMVGPRVGVSMLIASILTSYFLIPGLQESGQAEQVGNYVKWIAIGLMTIPAFTSIYFAFKFKTERELPTIFKPRDELPGDRLTSRDWRLIGAGAVVALLCSTWLMQDLFGVSPAYSIGCLILGGFICVMLGKVASETDINAVRLGAVVILFAFSMIANYGPISLLGLALIGAALASIAVDLFYDLRTGYLIGATPRHQVFVQYFGVIAASVVTATFLHWLATDFGFGEGKYFPAPGSVIWATLAKAVAGGGSTIAGGVWVAVAIATVLGVVFSYFENHPRFKRIIPSAFAMGIAMLIGFDMSAAICIGGLMRLAAVAMAKHRGEKAVEQRANDVFQVGAAIFAAAALTGIVAVLLITFGVVYLPV